VARLALLMLVLRMFTSCITANFYEVPVPILIPVDKDQLDDEYKGR
jgi:hypothetical protein